MERDDFIESAKDQLDLFDDRLIAAEQALRAQRVEAATTLQERVKETKQEVRRARERLEQATGATAQQWAGVERDIEGALTDVRRTVKEIAESLGAR